MDINTYKLFVAVAETRSISYTAEIMGYTQSGVSHSIKRMEKMLNIQLFVRDRYGVHLTPIGSEVLQHVRKLLAVNEQLDQFIYDIQGVEAGSLNIGTFSSVSVNWLPPIINLFSKEHPNITINLKEGGTNNLNEWVLNGKVDFAFCNKDDNQHLQFIPITSDEFLAIFPKDYPIPSDMESYPIKSFKKMPFILSEPTYDHNIPEILNKEKVHPLIRFSSQDDYAIMSMVENHLGTSILPELMIEQRKDYLKYLPLYPSYQRVLGISLKSFYDLSPAAKSFIYFVLDYFNLSFDIDGAI